MWKGGGHNPEFVYPNFCGWSSIAIFIKNELNTNISLFNLTTLPYQA
jgi:hypothetical protein